MSADEAKPEATPDAMQALWQPWNDFWNHVSTHNTDFMQALTAGTPAQADRNALRKRWFETMTKSMDGFVRSPQFLATMKRNLDAMVTAKMAADTAQHEVVRQAGLPLGEDVASLGARMEANHEVLLERLAEINHRLTALEARQVPSQPAASDPKR